MLKEAFALHTQGKFAEAEHAYAELLRREPKNFQALHLMGVLALQRQETARAIELMHQSLKLEPRQPLVHRDLGNALLQAGRFTEAVASYDRALALKSDLADVHNNRGIALSALQQPGKALESYNRAIALKPDYAQAYNNRGTVLMDQNRAADAVTDFTKAVALNPGYIKALNNRGQALMRLRQLEEALADHDRAIALAPDDAESHAMRATALVAQGRGEEALKSYDRAIALAPGLAAAHDGRGTALTILKRPREGLESHDRAIALDDGVSTYHNNRGSALATLDRKQDSDAASHADAVIKDEWRQEALKSFDRALALNPDSAQAHYNKANLLSDMKRYDEALESHARAITLDPNFTDAHFARSILLLTQGRFEEGWPAYEWRRKRVDPDTFHPAGRPEWSGREDIAGKTLFIEVEQALGDMIQVCRYAKLAADRGARVIMTAMDHQVRLLKELDPRVEVRPKAQRPEAFDYYIALMSLPRAFEARLDNIPAQVPYLRAEPERIARWRDRIGGNGFKIGVAWRGGANDLSRSFPLSLLAGIAAHPGVRLISLQKGDGSEQLERLPAGMKVENLGEDFDFGPDAFVDAAAVMETLDLIITCDTSLAHLAGALARPVWVALKYAPDWRFFMDRDDSPWYPSMRLFRQPVRDDWAGVFTTMATELDRAIVQKKDSVS